MDKKYLNRIRRSLLRHKVNLVEWLQDRRSSKWMPFANNGAPVEDSAENLEVLSRIETALVSVENGTFGKCELCEGEVETERLTLDFTTCVCLDHYSTEEIRELERDLEMAAKVQEYLLPRSLPVLPGVKIAMVARPAKVVGGDYCDFFRYREQCQGFAIADVMGKGVSASMLMANLQASLRIMGPDYPDLPRLAVRLNELFRYNLKQIRFITLFLAGYDPETQIMHYLNAGHHPPLLWEASAQSYKWLKPTGPAIGLFPEPQFSYKTLQFASGDMLLMYTDGLVEARNSEKEEFGQERLAWYLGENHTMSPEHFLNGLLNAAQSFGADIQDDLTLMVLKMD